MRFAFLTPEFITEYVDGGGLGNYLNRFTQVLVSAGHDVELFVPSAREPVVLDHCGIRVHRVHGAFHVLTRIANRAFRTIPGCQFHAHRHRLEMTARAMAVALESQHAKQPFDVVQSADYLGVGRFVRKSGDRVHVVRCSCPIDLYLAADGESGPKAKAQTAIEFAALRRADLRYCPSAFTAAHYANRLGIRFDVLRPPRSLEVTPAVELPFSVPGRFLIMCGQLTRRKGIEWLARALQIAMPSQPDLRIVVVGSAASHHLSSVFHPLAEFRDRILLLHALPKAQLMGVLSRAEAAVLPSLVDNLPNTVIESLQLGIPVIGTKGASIDELVEHGRTGLLVAPNDDVALAQAMLDVWNCKAPVTRGFTWDSEIAAEMIPENAVQNFIKYCRSH